MNLANLRKPFPPAKISWRIGSTNADKTKGMALAYIDARDVQDRLDEVCGIEGWQNRYVPMHDKKTVCEVGILVSRLEQAATGISCMSEWVWKSDGAGDSDVEAEKGALSDAFKRAAVKWGVGRYLYDLDSPWVAIEAAGRSFKIAAHEYKRLEALLAGNAPQTQAKAIHTPMQAPLAYQDEDVVAGVKSWCDEQKTFLKNCTDISDIQEWKELRADALDRLKRKALPAWSDLMKYVENRIGNINLEPGSKG